MDARQEEFKKKLYEDVCRENVIHQQEIARLEKENGELRKNEGKVNATLELLIPLEMNEFGEVKRCGHNTRCNYVKEIARLEKELDIYKTRKMVRQKTIKDLQKENARIKGISVRDIEDTIEIIHNKYRIPGLAKQIHSLIQGGGK